ncbi:SDR family NAD(P)-dependent oxidoreductase (plasmid) [Pseudoalteromonas xiamenensis]|uniref:SDR family NAD(P)-dependent oxidoreductase n=1 Tax=Pseudoalteromonas xiamenensis TaxID=882626 RepID=UPI0027E561DE|nr:SDR family NAD(P)-dependent oxidoreductase [Pseudoalteromonas xiamenensis]WMN62218.1 SDR family NAD(P)-dependent oxidoreductase [Pseudoalteromonas xiamenensis]
MKQYLLIGASSGIAQALISIFQENPKVKLVSISRANIVTSSSQHVHFVSDYSISSVREIASSLIASQSVFDYVLFFNGTLHHNQMMPEKQVTQFSEEYYDHLTASNVYPHIRWFAELPRLLCRNSIAKIIILSARIGSISDNRSGGWYSYRMTKAALNMAAKTFSLELNRPKSRAKVILFHPGTTDTALSKPFQKNIPKEKLFTPHFVAQRLSALCDAEIEHTDIDFIDWRFNPIQW